MQPSFFLEPSMQPDAAMLALALGTSNALWEELKNYLGQEHGTLTGEWKCYSKTSGWTMKLLHKKRNLFFFTPLKNSFRLGFVFGNKAVAAIEQSDIPKRLIDELLSAKKYAEGRGLRVVVKTKKDVAVAKRLVAMKMGN